MFASSPADFSARVMPASIPSATISSCRDAPGAPGCGWGGDAGRWLAFFAMEVACRGRQRNGAPGSFRLSKSIFAGRADAPCVKPANARASPPHELADYIFQTHHQFLWCEMPRLHAMAERVKECFSWCAGIVVWTHRLFSLSIDLLAPVAMVECTADPPPLDRQTLCL